MESAMPRRSLAVLAFLPLLAGALDAQPADTTKISTKPLFTRKDAYMAVAFLATTAALTPLDERLAQRLQDSTLQANRIFGDLATGVEYITAPGAFIIGGTMSAIGRLGGNERLADLGWHGTEAVLVGTAVYSLGKGLFGRARPETVDASDARAFQLGRGFGGGAYASFPSGHTTTAFAAAAAVTSETSRWWPKSTWIVAPVMYGGATSVGLSRMYHNKHWGSDVVMGALLGTFAGLKVVQYHHSHPNNRLDRWMLGKTRVAMLPTGEALAMVVIPLNPE
jgi:membrane-associated phospholipid phosphatase